MHKLMVVKVCGNQVEMEAYGQPKMFGVEKPDIVADDDRDSWGIVKDGGRFSHKRGHFAANPKAAGQFITVIDLEHPYEVSKAMSGAIKLNQRAIRLVIGLEK